MNFTQAAVTRDDAFRRRMQSLVVRGLVLWRQPKEEQEHADLRSRGAVHIRGVLARVGQGTSKEQEGQRPKNRGPWSEGHEPRLRSHGRRSQDDRIQDGLQPENCFVSEKGGNPRTAVQRHVYGVCSPDAE